MKYRVVIPPKVQKDLERIDSRYRPKIHAGLVILAGNPYIGKKLKGDREDELSYEVWPYRILYRIKKHDLIILVIRIGHRQGVYS